LFAGQSVTGGVRTRAVAGANVTRQFGLFAFRIRRRAYGSALHHCTKDYVLCHGSKDEL